MEGGLGWERERGWRHERVLMEEREGREGLWRISTVKMRNKNDHG